MKKIVIILWLHLFMWTLSAAAGVESANDQLEGAIHYLLTYVKNSDCIFIRNDKEHTAKEAVAHILIKYEHFKDEIKTPEDFIRLTTSKSLMTGKPYWIKTANGEKIKSEVWLLKALELYRTAGRQQKVDRTTIVQPQ